MARSTLGVVGVAVVHVCPVWYNATAIDWSVPSPNVYVMSAYEMEFGGYTVLVVANGDVIFTLLLNDVSEHESPLVPAWSVHAGCDCRHVAIPTMCTAG